MGGSARWMDGGGEEGGERCSPQVSRSFFSASAAPAAARVGGKRFSAWAPQVVFCQKKMINFLNVLRLQTAVEEEGAKLQVLLELMLLRMLF
ncbi:hypothetical protein ABZP36_027832 [Zizania latifolia]